MSINDPDRGTVTIKPIYIGIHHYQNVYGSVCSPDMKGAPPIDAPTATEIRDSVRRMIEQFHAGTEAGFVEVAEPYVVAEHRDMRALASELTYDVDALLVGSYGQRPWEEFTLAQYGIPIISGPVSDEFLRALRVKRFLRQSKFLYIGEIPSFSAPSGPYDFNEIEQRLGVRVRHIETNHFYRIFDGLSEAEVAAELDTWQQEFGRVEPDRQSMLEAVRAYLALRRLCETEDANGVTINCGRFTEERPIVPCLAFDRLIDEGIMCACEGDITAMLASLLLHAASEQPVLMGNFGYREGMFEARAGEVTIEHDIIPASMASEPYTVRDYHGRQFGVTAYADIKRDQPMTLLNLDSSLDEIVVIEGHTISSEDGIHCRIIIHMSVDGDVAALPELLVGSQHVCMAYGHWLGVLNEARDLLGLKLRHL